MTLEEFIRDYEEHPYYKVLKKEKLIEIWYNYTINTTRLCSISDLLKRPNFKEFLSGSFVWADTKERHTFWEDLANKYKDVKI